MSSHNVKWQTYTIRKPDGQVIGVVMLDTNYTAGIEVIAEATGNPQATIMTPGRTMEQVFAED